MKSSKFVEKSVKTIEQTIMKTKLKDATEKVVEVKKRMHTSKVYLNTVV